jgi:tetratricopeptide (TPR) repeat protein
MLASLRTLVAGLVALGAAAAVNLRLAGELQIRPYDVEHVPTGRFARIASLGQRGIVSDLYWLATVQYIGEPSADQRGWEKLHPLVDLVTDLDPRHGYAYQTAGIVLSATGRLDESEEILKKGIEKGPNWWSYPYYIAFNHWFYRGDYATGARWAEIAAKAPGASRNISHLAVSLASKSGTPEQAIAMLEELRGTVQDEASAARLDEQLKLAVLERDAQLLERAAAEYTRRSGLPLVTLHMLVMSGVVSQIPPDPFGGHYVWDSEKRQVRSSVNPFRFSPRERGRAPTFHYQYQPKPRPSEGTSP